MKDVVSPATGTGSTALIHAPYVHSIHGIDYSTRMIEIALAKARAGGVSNVTFESDRDRYASSQACRRWAARPSSTCRDSAAAFGLESRFNWPIRFV